jgi:acetyl-CoA carboxylase biotin carboxylase subunit
LELPEMIDRMGDKASASTMIEAGVPCVPSSVGILESYNKPTIIKRFWLSSNA